MWGNWKWQLKKYVWICAANFKMQYSGFTLLGCTFSMGSESVSLARDSCCGLEMPVFLSWANPCSHLMVQAGAGDDRSCNWMCRSQRELITVKVSKWATTKTNSNSNSKWTWGASGNMFPHHVTGPHYSLALNNTSCCQPHRANQHRLKRLASDWRLLNPMNCNGFTMHKNLFYSCKNKTI